MDVHSAFLMAVVPSIGMFARSWVYIIISRYHRIIKENGRVIGCKS